MCLLAVCVDRKLSTEEFTVAWKNNSDGVGFGWCENNEVHFHKGFMKLKNAMAFYKDFKPNLHVVHFRQSTCGGVVPCLTHPFVIGGLKHFKGNVYIGKKSILFHNGIITDWKKHLTSLALSGIKLPKPINDSMVMAIVVGKLMQNANLSMDDILNDEAGKFAVVHADKVNWYGVFHEINGVHFSNYSYFYDKSAKWYDNTYDYSDTRFNYHSKHKNKHHPCYHDKFNRLWVWSHIKNLYELDIYRDKQAYFNTNNELMYWHDKLQIYVHDKYFAGILPKVGERW